jgi:ATP-dependent Clp protease ATP-binding subunit ClpA
MTSNYLNKANAQDNSSNLPLSYEFLSVESFMTETLSKELPIATIDLDYFLLGVLSQKRNDLFFRLDNILTSSSIEAIYNSLYQVISSKCLTAIKPNRRVLFSENYQKILTNAETEARKLDSPVITTEHFFLAILNDEVDGNKIKKIFNKAGITYGIYLNKMSQNDINDIDNIEKENPFKNKEVKVINLGPMSKNEFEDVMKNMGGTVNDLGAMFENMGGKKKKKGFIASYCTNINNLVRLGYSMESSCHKRIIIRSITKYYQFSTTQRILFLCIFCSFLNHFTHQFYGVHVNTGLCRT